MCSMKFPGLKWFRNVQFLILFCDVIGYIFKYGSMCSSEKINAKMLDEISYEWLRAILFFFLCFQLKHIVHFQVEVNLINYII